MSGTQTTCECWEPSRCEGTAHCPPRCPRFVDDRGTAWLVEPYDPTHRDALVATYADFAPAARWRGVPPRREEAIAEWLADLVEDGCNFVVRSGESVVGHAAYAPTDAAEPKFAAFVHRRYRGRGLRAELTRHVVATAAAGSRDALVVDVERRDRAAMDTYQRLGFERVEKSTAADDTESFGVVRMRLPLDESVALDAQRAPMLRG